MRRVGVFNSMNNCLGLYNHLNLIVVVKVECHIWGGLFNRNIEKAIQIVLDNNRLDDICASFPSTNIIWMIVDICQFCLIRQLCS